MALSLIRFTPFRLFLILLTLQNHIPKVVETTRKNAMAQLENHGGKGFPKRVCSLTEKVDYFESYL